MRLAISGASGKTGYRIAEEAIKAGHQINLIVRKNSKIPETLESFPRSNISLFKTKEVDKSLEKAQALIIATGARPSVDISGPARIDALGVKKQIESCKRIGIKRIILVSSLCSGKLLHPLNLFGLILVWKKCGENFLQNSGIDWTIIRPGGLTEQEDDLDKQGIIFTSENVQQDGSIPRRLVAKTCIEALNTDKSIARIIEITSNEKQQKVALKDSL